MASGKSIMKQVEMCRHYYWENSPRCKVGFRGSILWHSWRLDCRHYGPNTRDITKLDAITQKNHQEVNNECI